MSKKEEILTLANRELQEKGVASLSFRELAAKLGIKSSSVHYYFPQKDDLIEAIAQDYATGCFQQIGERTKSVSAGKARIAVMLDFIHEQLESRLCTAGILAAESAYISDPTRKTITIFFEDLRKWLHDELKAEKKPEKDAATLSRVILAAIEGCLMIDSLNDQGIYLKNLKAFVTTL